jgi:hypothetical protein
MSDRPGGTSLRLVFETHATSVDNESGIASGWADAPLSPPGEEQARALGVRRPADAWPLCSAPISCGRGTRPRSPSARGECRSSAIAACVSATTGC